MRKTLTSQIIATIVLVSFTACSFTLTETGVQQPLAHMEKPQAKYPPFEMPKINIEASDLEIKAFSNEIQKLVDKRDFKGLDDRAKFYATNKERFIGGGWKVRSVGAVVRTIGDKSIPKLIDFLEDWLKISPDSIFARSLLVTAHISYAWEARGNDFADKVSENNWRIFQERLENANLEFKRASELTERCHEFFESALELAKAQNWERKDYEKIFAEAVKYEASYQYFYTAKAINLMPRWGGKQGEWEKFASDVRESFGGGEGLKMYYLIVTEVSELKADDFFRENRVSWADTKEGFRLMATEYGVTNHKMSSFALLAKKAKDMKVTCTAFKELSADKIDTTYWNDRAAFDSSRQVAEMMCNFPEVDNQAK